MKKSLLKLFAAFFACATLAFGFTACDAFIETGTTTGGGTNTEQGEACTHPAETTWSFDETHHWHNSTCDCNVKVDYAEHTIDDSGCCTVCEQPILPTDGVCYAVPYDGTYAKVVGYTGTATRVKIADTYEGLPVTSIDNDAFKNAAIVSIVIPDSVASIGNYVFCFCSSLTSVTLGDGVTSIGEGVFVACSSLTSVTIGNSVTSIGDWAFASCSGLMSVAFGNSVASIGDGAFNNCDSLKKVNYTGTIDQWVEIDFDDYSSNPTYYAKNLYINNELVTETNVTTATKINAYAFYGYDSLTSVTLGNSVTSIGESTFTYCSSLMSVTLGNSVTSIEENAFHECHKLVEVINKSELIITKRSFNFGSVGFYALIVHNGESMIVDKEGYSFITNGGRNYLLGYTGSETELVLPNDYNGETYRIYDYAFEDCSSLTSVTIGNGVTAIGFKAFNDCHSLMSVTLGDGVTSIGESVFVACSSLTSVTIPDSVTSIGDWAFSWCTGLTSVTIPDSVTSIGNGAFYNCSKLTSVYYKGTESEWNNISIGDNNSSLKNAMRYYYSETEPTTLGNYWHYDENGNVAVW